MEEVPTKDIEIPFELAQSNVGGTITEGISPYPDADTGFGEERLQPLFGPGALGFNPAFAALGIAAVSVTDNSGHLVLPTTEGDTQPDVSNISGVVIDGYIRGAKVFFDTDGDGQHDEGEAFTMTDDEGKYVLEVSQGVEGVIRAVGGININPDGSDGVPNTATLSAPLVHTDDKSIALNITPVTSLIEALVQSEDGLAVDEASSRLASALGFPGIDLLTFDSILAETQGEDSAQQAQALLLNKIAAQVVSLINSVSAALQPDAANRAAVDSVVAQSVTRQVVTKIINSESSTFESLSSFLDSDALNIVVQTAVTAVMDIEDATSESPVRDIASVVAVAKGSANAQFAAIDRASSAISIAAEQVAIFNNKAPTAGASQTISVAENSKDVGVFEVTDPDEGDAIAYSLAGNDAVFFDIDSMTGSVRFKIAPDFEQLEGRPFQFTVLATDKLGASSTRQVTVNVTDVDEVEVIKALTVQIAQLKKDLADIKTEQEAVQKASEEEITKLKADVEALTKSGLAKDTEIDAIKKQIAELEAKSAQAAKDAEAKVLDLGKQIVALESSGKAKDADIAALKDDLTKAKASAEVAQKALAAEVTTWKDDVSTLKVALAEREEDVAVLKQIIEEFGANLDKVILGSTGNDTVTNKAGENFIYSLSGNDTIVYNGIGELFDGGMVDLINGGPGVDTLRLVEANRTIDFAESWARATGIEILQVAGTQNNVNGFQAHLDKSAFAAGIRTVDLQEIVAMPGATLTSVVDGSNAASDQGLSLLGTSGNDLFTGGAGKDMLVAYDGADVYRGGAESDNIDLSETSPARDRVVFESTSELNGVDYIKGFTTGLASEQADILDLSAFVASPTGLSVTLSDGTSGDIIRLLDLEGGQDITTAEGLLCLHVDR